jgi:type I restriction enzyme M protein
LKEASAPSRAPVSTRRNKAGEFYTPRSVVRMMVEILDPKEGESIYDK